MKIQGVVLVCDPGSSDLSGIVKELGRLRLVTFLGVTAPQSQAIFFHYRPRLRCIVVARSMHKLVPVFHDLGYEGRMIGLWRTPEDRLRLHNAGCPILSKRDCRIHLALSVLIRGMCLGTPTAEED